MSALAWDGGSSRVTGWMGDAERSVLSWGARAGGCGCEGVVDCGNGGCGDRSGGQARAAPRARRRRSSKDPCANFDCERSLNKIVYWSNKVAGEGAVGAGGHWIGPSMLGGVFRPASTRAQAELQDLVLKWELCCAGTPVQYIPDPDGDWTEGDDPLDDIGEGLGDYPNMPGNIA